LKSTTQQNIIKPFEDKTLQRIFQMFISNIRNWIAIEL